MSLPTLEILHLAAGVLGVATYTLYYHKGEDSLHVPPGPLTARNSPSIWLKTMRESMSTALSRPPAAANGTLTAMIGHMKPTELGETGQQVRSISGTMSDPEKIFSCGKVGAGLAAKMSNNYIACTMMLVASEATAIAVRSGIELEILHEIIRNSSGQTLINDIMRSPAKAPAGFQRGVPVSNDRMVKDLSLVINAGHETDINPKMAMSAQEIWREAAKDPSVLHWEGFQGL